MTITLRTKLAAYEDSLIEMIHLKMGPIRKESQDIKEQLPIKDDSGTNESKNQVMETVEPDLFSSSIVEEKKEEIESAVPKEFVLTAEAINQEISRSNDWYGKHYTVYIIKESDDTDALFIGNIDQLKSGCDTTCASSAF